jgi:methylase of polypeptide subunit release factors
MPDDALRPNAAAIADVRGLLATADYSTGGIAGLGIDLGMGVRAPDIPLLRRAVEHREPLSTLVRLFVLGEVVDDGTLQRVVGAAAARALTNAGLTRVIGRRIEPAVRLTPWRGLLFAHDPDPQGDLWPEHVSGPTPAADALIRLVTTNGGDGLDLGTGAGLFAAVLAAGQSRVVATDVNPAALRLAAVNRLLNDLPTIEIRAGSLFEPVADDTFDLIVSNPPFVISPETELLFRHSSFGRDEVSRTVVREAAAHLREGGMAYILVNWVQPPDAGWLEVLGSWIDDSSCDAVCFLHGVEDPLGYTARWTAREQQLMPDRHGRTVDRWLAHLRHERIEAIGSGAVVLRRRTGENWIHGLQLAGDGRGDAGPQVQAIIRGQDLIAGVLDAPDRGAASDIILGSVLRMSGGHRVTQSLLSRDGEYVSEPAMLTADEGLALPVEVPNDLVAALLRLDGTQSGLEIARDIAAAGDGDVDASNARVAAFLRALLDRGFVEPATAAARTQP